ncbi:cupin domain-containing protein [Phenylobacterium sp.]|uniref:cupin domain-containing protein n=1 Tax=Phenylobacterium sp. TaxID=1871053 RepID=UPI002D0A2E70|nr:cupin domain-containing protein [Phenylobacterium sp.]HLZ77550.1 cupin domain-containing protein [Phenylobacterium sp.]
MAAFDLETTYLSLDGQGAVGVHPVGPDFWATIGQNRDILGTLVTVSGGDRDWTSWEMHPQGDEILVLLEGRATMVLDGGGEETRHAMQPGTTLVIPKGTWHRALIAEPMRMLFVTYGAGTTHRPL